MSIDEDGLSPFENFMFILIGILMGLMALCAGHDAAESHKRLENSTVVSSNSVNNNVGP